jgi:hypothetical protein
MSEDAGFQEMENTVHSLFLKKYFRSFFSRAHLALLVAKRANMTFNKVLQEKNMGIKNDELKADT